MEIDQERIERREIKEHKRFKKQKCRQGEFGKCDSGQIVGEKGERTKEKKGERGRGANIC